MLTRVINHSRKPFLSLRQLLLPGLSEATSGGGGEGGGYKAPRMGSDDSSLKIQGRILLPL